MLSTSTGQETAGTLETFALANLHQEPATIVVGGREGIGLYNNRKNDEPLSWRGGFRL
jgi:hypothetical protein